MQTECDDDREEVHRTVTLPRPGGAARCEIQRDRDSAIMNIPNTGLWV